jgi:hypothetical protein
MTDVDNPAVLHYRVALMEKAVQEIGLALGGIRETLQTLATLEVRHTETREAMTRAFASITGLDARVDAIEKALPLLQETSKWVRLGVIAVVGMVGTAAIKIVLSV